MPKLKYETEDGTLFDNIEDAHQYELACRFFKEFEAAPSVNGPLSVMHLLHQGWQIIPPPAAAADQG